MRDAALARAHEGCSVASLVWSAAGALHVTVIVKATVSLRPGGPAALVTPAPVEPYDRWGDHERPTSLVAASELFPYRPRVDVTFTGHAHLGSTGTGGARFAVTGRGGWIDKSLDVRSPPARGRTRSPVSRVPLIWEGTWADPDNPVGVVPHGPLRAWITDPTRPGAAMGLGPLAASWPRRSASLGGHDPRFLDDDAPTFPESFDWEHFHAAPLDQQINWLEGDETIELEGLVEGHPHLQTRLPGLAAAAWAFAPWEVAEGQPLDLTADGLVIDGDAGLAHVLWRGTYPVLHPEWSLSQLQFLASVTASVQPEERGARWSSLSGSGEDDDLSLTPPPPVEIARTPPPPPPRTLAGLGPAVPVASLFETDDGEDEGTRPLTRKEILAAMASAGKALPFGPPRRDVARTSEIELPVPPPSPGMPIPGMPIPGMPAPGMPVPGMRPAGARGSEPGRRAEETRPLPLRDLLTDPLTVTGDQEILSQAATGGLPSWLREGPPSSRAARHVAVDDTPEAPAVDDTPEASAVDDVVDDVSLLEEVSVDEEISADEEASDDDASLLDEETHVDDEVSRRR